MKQDISQDAVAASTDTQIVIAPHNERYITPEVRKRLPELREKAHWVYHRLMEHYGEPTWRAHRPPLDELIITTLAQNSTDRNALKAFRTLKERFPTWEDVLRARPEEVIDAVRSAGLANQKGPRIQAILRKLKEEQGDFDLSFLERMSTEEAEAWLTSIKGIGHKTASILLLFNFQRPTFPVDTHVSRVSKRLGMAPPRASTRQIRAIWETVVPPEWYYPLHLNLIRHGREVCKARTPLCDQCVLQERCDTYQGIRRWENA